MYRSYATIEDVFRLALPSATTMLAGNQYLGRSVSWACSLRPSPPAFPKLDGDELALIDMDDLRQLDPKMRLERVVRGLRDAHVAAVAVQGDFGDNAVKAAQASDIALFALPGGVPLNQIERSVIRLIVDRSGYLAQRSSELQRELNQIALDGGGLSQIANHLAAFTQAPAAIVSDDGRVIAHALNEGAGAAGVEAALSALPNIFELRSWAAAQGAPRRSGAIGILPLRDGGGASSPYCQIVVSPIIATESVRGYCLLLRPSQSFDWDLSAVEEIAVTEGASASALEWAKQYAVDVAEERMRAAFLDELLASEIADEAAWIQRGASLGYDLATPHAAWLVEVRGVPSWPQPAVDFLERMQVPAPYSKRHAELLLFWPIDNARSARELKEIAANLSAQVLAKHPSAEFIVGIGRPAVGPAQWPRSQQQARECWRLGKEWNAAVTYFGDLGLYQLLTSLSANPESTRFYRKTMGLLIAHDDNKNSELVDTLEAFFACHGNLSQTSSRLHIHRNTLSYRLERIQAIANLDLNDPDARFSLQLALKLRPLMK